MVSLPKQRCWDGRTQSIPGVRQVVPPAERDQGAGNDGAGETKRSGQARYRWGIAKSERHRDGHLEVLADHSTASSESCFPDWERWGSEAQTTHCREGEAGYNV